MGFLTPKMKKVLEFIRDYYTEHGYAPSYHDIQKYFHFTSASTPHKYVYRLAREGFLRRKPGRHRGIELIERPEKEESTESVVWLPMMGTIAAGQPIEKVVTEEYVPIPKRMIRSPRSFVLEVRGDSMIDDHIVNGDWVIVEDRQAVHPGEIVVAEIDGEVTLKRYRPKGTKIILEPSNPRHTPIIVPAKELKVHGVAIGLIRQWI